MKISLARLMRRQIHFSTRPRRPLTPFQLYNVKASEMNLNESLTRKVYEPSLPTWSNNSKWCFRCIVPLVWTKLWITTMLSSLRFGATARFYNNNSNSKEHLLILKVKLMVSRKLWIWYLLSFKVLKHRFLQQTINNF